MLLKWKAVKSVSLWGQTLIWIPWLKHIFPCELSLPCCPVFSATLLVPVSAKLPCLEKWTLQLCRYFSIWPLNSCLHSLVGSNGTMSTRASCQGIYAARQWRRRSSLQPADEYAVSLILHLKQRCKACSLLDCQKKLHWITQVWIYFVPAFLLFLLQPLIIVIIKVISGSGTGLTVVIALSSLGLWRRGCCRWLRWCLRLFVYTEMRETWEKCDDMRERTESDSNWQP